MSKTFLLIGASSAVAQQLASDLKQEGNRVMGISTKDLAGAKFDMIYKLAAYTSEDLPLINSQIDGLVYFPGTINLKPFARIKEEEFLNDFRINALGAAMAVQKYLPNLKQSAAPSVVFISSVASSVGMPFHASVSMAKAALEGLVVSLAAELATVVRVNAIAPSLTNTPLAEKFVNTPEKMEASQKRNPMKQVGNPQDLANAISFLLSEKASWITGQTLAVDGGMNKLKLM